MKLAIFKFITKEKFDNSFGEKFRGFVGDKFKDVVMLHNHISLYELLYKSPLVQYKIIDGTLSIIGINKGIEVITNNLLSLEKITLGDKTYEVLDINFEEKEINVTIGQNLNRYKFDTLWIALNSENYNRFKEGTYDLNKALTNNIIEFFKMIGLWADKPILVNGVFTKHSVTKKDTRLIGFAGEFVCNVDLPDYIGLGKRKSIGFGTIKII